MERTETESEPAVTGNRALGFEVIEAGEGRSLLRLHVERRHIHAEEDPRVAGGVIMGLADAAAHHAIASLLGDGEMHATVEVKVSFISPGRLGVLEAEGVILHMGGRFAVSEVTIRQDGRLVAKALGTETTVARRRDQGGSLTPGPG